VINEAPKHGGLLAEFAHVLLGGGVHPDFFDHATIGGVLDGSLINAVACPTPMDVRRVGVCVDEPPVFHLFWRIPARTPELKDALTLHRQWLEFDKVPNRDTLMFPSSTGALRTPNTLNFAKQKCLELAGIDRRFTIHGCRYSFTKLTQLARVDAVKGALAGHVIEQMQHHYSYVDVAEKREAMEVAMNVLKAAKAEAERKKG
jgi:hypothetical protein